MGPRPIGRHGGGRDATRGGLRAVRCGASLGLGWSIRVGRRVGRASDATAPSKRRAKLARVTRCEVVREQAPPATVSAVRWVTPAQGAAQAVVAGRSPGDGPFGEDRVSARVQTEASGCEVGGDVGRTRGVPEKAGAAGEPAGIGPSRPRLGVLPHAATRGVWTIGGSSARASEGFGRPLRDVGLASLPRERWLGRSEVVGCRSFGDDRTLRLRTRRRGARNAPAARAARLGRARGSGPVSARELTRRHVTVSGMGSPGEHRARRAGNGAGVQRIHGWSKASRSAGFAVR